MKKNKPVETEPILTIGQNVHYIGLDAVHRAAAITHVFDGGIVNLYVYPDGVSTFEPVVRHVGHNENMLPQTWHFIEK